MGRRNQLSDKGAFGTGDSSRADLTEFDAAMYGSVGKVDEHRQIAEALPITSIWPDQTQPRRAVPSSVRRGWDGNPNTVGQLLNRWISGARATLMVDVKFDLAELVEARNDDLPEFVQQIHERPGEFPVLESLLKVVNLAASIRRDGLINPITVSRTARDYILETGERRWLAYHLLSGLYGDDWKLIAARVVKRDVWRQAAENTARENLNAIAKARQFAILLMELYHAEDWSLFEDTVDLDGCDRTYYAQVADGNHWRIPRGKGPLLLNAMGEKSTPRLREYRTLLRLEDDLWVQADDENWPLSRVVETLRPPTPEQTDDGYTVQIRTVSDSGDTDTTLPEWGSGRTKTGEASVDEEAYSDTPPRATPTGQVPGVDPSQAMGRERNLPRLNATMAKQLTDKQLGDYLDDHQLVVAHYFNPDYANGLIEAEMVRRDERYARATGGNGKRKKSGRKAYDSTPIAPQALRQQVEVMMHYSRDQIVEFVGFGMGIDTLAGNLRQIAADVTKHKDDLIDLLSQLEHERTLDS